MKRSKRENYDGNAPLLDRRTLLASLGGLTGAAILPGCISPPTLENEEPPPAPTYEIQLPISPESHTIWLGHGFMDYHVELLVRGTPIADWVEDNRPELLPALDEALYEHDISEFGEGQDWSDVETELIQVIADARAGEVGASTSGLLRLDLVIDYYDDDPDIAGDWG